MSTQVHFVFFVIGLTVFWYVFHTQYREQRIAYLRERLFEIRDGLFQEAKNGTLSFNDEAYGMMRLTLNGLIRFAHEFTFTDIWLAYVKADLKRGHAVSDYKQHWEAAYEQLSDEGKEVIKEARLSMHIYAFSHVADCSLILHSVALLIDLVARIAEIVTKFVHATDGQIKQRWKLVIMRKSEPMQDVLDLQAIIIGRNLNRQAAACRQLAA